MSNSWKRTKTMKDNKKMTDEHIKVGLEEWLYKKRLRAISPEAGCFKVQRPWWKKAPLASLSLYFGSVRKHPMRMSGCGLACLASVSVILLGAAPRRALKVINGIFQSALNPTGEPEEGGQDWRNVTSSVKSNKKPGCCIMSWRRDSYSSLVWRRWGHEWLFSGSDFVLYLFTYVIPLFLLNTWFTPLKSNPVWIFCQGKMACLFKGDPK